MGGVLVTKEIYELIRNGLTQHLRGQFCRRSTQHAQSLNKALLVWLFFASPSRVGAAFPWPRACYTPLHLLHFGSPCREHCSADVLTTLRVPDCDKGKGRGSAISIAKSLVMIHFHKSSDHSFKGPEMLGLAKSTWACQNISDQVQNLLTRQIHSCGRGPLPKEKCKEKEEAFFAG